MIYKVISYFIFLLKSKNQHGVHSPFVYDLVTKCFYQKTNLKKATIYSSIKNTLSHNNTIISVTDFGAKSKVFKTEQRRIKAIAKHVGLSTKRAQLLIRISAYFSPKHILEFGTSIGLSASAISLGNPNSTITTLEGCPETAQIAKNQFEKFNLNNINVVVGEFDQSLSQLKMNQPLDMVYFDGNHQKNATLKYFEHCLQHIHNDSFFIFDDIHWSKQMAEAWEEIKQHPEVRVTIDTYQWGIVFFRKEQEKEHFTIRV
jgi:predicted O-methyltransferase YrrM